MASAVPLGGRAVIQSDCSTSTKEPVMANQGLDTVIGMSEAARRDPQAAAKQLG